jgi:asparagine synthetase B (glutamine-hydrolysing)
MIKNIYPSQISGGIARSTRVIESANMDFVDRLESKQIGLKRMERQKLLKGLGKDIRPAKEFIEETLKPVGGMDNFNKLNYWLLKVYLPDDILCKVDRTSMANSLETRLPFLDHRIIELMCSVSMSIKLKGYTRKHVLRGSVGKKLPVKLLKAKKRGFAMPVDKWLGNRSGTFLNMEAMQAAIGSLVDRNALNEIINKNKLAGYNAGNTLWMLGMLGSYPKTN